MRDLKHNLHQPLKEKFDISGNTLTFFSQIDTALMSVGYIRYEATAMSCLA